MPHARLGRAEKILPNILFLELTTKDGRVVLFFALCVQFPEKQAFSFLWQSRCSFHAFPISFSFRF